MLKIQILTWSIRKHLFVHLIYFHFHSTKVMDIRWWKCQYFPLFLLVTIHYYSHAAMVNGVTLGLQPATNRRWIKWLNHFMCITQLTMVWPYCPGITCQSTYIVINQMLANYMIVRLYADICLKRSRLSSKLCKIAMSRYLKLGFIHEIFNFR